MTISDVGISLQIFGIILAIGPTKLWLAVRFYEIILIIKRKDILKIEENRQPHAPKEKLYKNLEIFKMLKKKLDETIENLDYEEFLKSDFSKMMSGIGVLFLVIGLILQFSWLQ